MSELKRMSFFGNYYNSSETFNASVELIVDDKEVKYSGFGKNAIEAVKSAILKAFPRIKEKNISYRIQGDNQSSASNARATVSLAFGMGDKATGSETGNEAIIVFAKTLVKAIDLFEAQG